MGKRVNLAALAQEDVPDDYSPDAARDAAPPAQDRSSSSDARKPAESTTLPADDVATNPLNRRPDRDLWDEEFQQLVATMREHGVLQPIVVCSAEAFLRRYRDQRSALNGANWVALIGNRRLRAAREAGLGSIPVVVNDDRVASMYEVMLVENSHRRDLGPLHEAEAMQQALADSKMSQSELATRIGRSRAYITQRLTLLDLVPALQQALVDGQIKVEQARHLGTLPADEQKQIAAAGPPFRRSSRTTDDTSGGRRRTFTAATPAAAADSIRRLFSPTELEELIQLLSGDAPPDAER